MSAAIRDNSALLALLARASETLQIVAVQDICDVAGNKLVAHEQILNAELQARLTRRPLRKPLETSIRAEAGVTLGDIEQTALKLCQASAFLVVVVGQDFASLRRMLHALTLPPFVHVMLSLQRAALPQLFSHSVLCSVVAGALAMKLQGPPVNAQLAMAAGLVHDIGEMYRDADTSQRIAGANRDRWQEIVVHPQIASDLIAQFTDYPESVSRAVLEHHEKLDGSGYPHGLSGPELSPLGRVLSLADTICGVINTPDNQGARAKLAVSFVPGEFDPQLVSALTAAVRSTLAAEIALPASYDQAQALSRAKAMSKGLDEAHRQVELLAHARLEDQDMAAVVAIAQHRIERLKIALEATGINGYFAEQAQRNARLLMDAEAYFDLDVVSRELTWRMRSLSRNLLLLLQQRRLASYGALEAVIAALEITS